MAPQRARRAVTGDARASVRRAAAVPAVLLAVAVVGGGLGAAILQSVGLMPWVGAPALDAAAFRRVAPDLPSSLLVSLAVASASTVIGAVVGLATALAIVGSSRAVSVLSKLTIPVPHLIGAASIGLLLSDTASSPGSSAWLRTAGPTSWPAAGGGLSSPSSPGRRAPSSAWWWPRRWPPGPSPTPRSRPPWGPGAHSASGWSPGCWPGRRSWPPRRSATSTCSARTRWRWSSAAATPNRWRCSRSGWPPRTSWRCDPPAVPWRWPPVASACSSSSRPSSPFVAAPGRG